MHERAQTLDSSERTATESPAIRADALCGDRVNYRDFCDSWTDAADTRHRHDIVRALFGGKRTERIVFSESRVGSSFGAIHGKRRSRQSKFPAGARINCRRKRSALIPESSGPGVQKGAPGIDFSICPTASPASFLMRK